MAKVLLTGEAKKPRAKKKTPTRQELNLLMRSAVFTNWGKSRKRQIYYLSAKETPCVSRGARSKQENVGEHS